MARTSRRQYYQDLRQRVIKKWAAGMSERKIGRHLDMPRASVQTIIRLQMKHGHVNLKPHPSLAAVTSVTIAVSYGKSRSAVRNRSLRRCQRRSSDPSQGTSSETAFTKRVLTARRLERNPT
ncbi:hypothetical protein JG687_00010712 [Phytophthora cactorum]|uniref:Homeodomain-like n=1 Tax=Phytophthora cactorum TaxID=29920 RepID=A0A329T061_9STRA|nr:hypothetical protein Pcac1_g2965 [Phytophthora cactorum]KAG3200398.1 hypothetical protein PC128_g4618 [Phytophthora cactorum]KAG4242532.1 hypothetical protein PC116_g9540 [Phytophthora cactorum]KAG6956251.1 hypothetical protein JG687_00010712 [Phytophthora cactorum]RAW42185.1 hypothetical protein PC110_g1658 [Phytophthora cactorum]